MNKKEESVFREALRIREALIGLIMAVAGIGAMVVLIVLKLDIPTIALMGIALITMLGARMLSKHISEISARRLAEKEKKGGK